jgi:hypothetical protein
MTNAAHEQTHREGKRIFKAMERQGGGVYSTGILRAPFANFEPFWFDQIRRWSLALHLRWLAEGQKGSAICLTCDAEFPPNAPAAMAAFAPYVDAPPDAIVLSAICDKCAKRSDDEISRAMMLSLVPNGRELPKEHLHPYGGHA